MRDGAHSEAAAPAGAAASLWVLEVIWYGEVWTYLGERSAILARLEAVLPVQRVAACGPVCDDDEFFQYEERAARTKSENGFFDLRMRDWHYRQEACERAGREMTGRSLFDFLMTRGTAMERIACREIIEAESRGDAFEGDWLELGASL